MSKIDSLSKNIQTNSALMPYFEAISELNEPKQPKNKLEAGLYYLALNLGYSNKSANIEDLKKFYSSDNEETNGIYWNGENWVIFQEGTGLTGNDIKIVAGTENKIYDKLIKHLKDSEVQKKLYKGAMLCSYAEKLRYIKYYQSKARASLHILDTAGTAHSMLEANKQNSDLIKQALKQSKSSLTKKIKRLQDSRLELQKLSIKIENIPSRILHNKSFFIFWYVLKTKLDKKTAANITDLFKKQHDNNKNSIPSLIEYVKKMYFIKNNSLGSYKGKNFLGKNTDLEWSEKEKCWRAISKEKITRIGLLENLIDYLKNNENSTAYYAEKAFDKIHGYINSNQFETSKALAFKIKPGTKWTKLDASELPNITAFKNTGNQPWKFFRLGLNLIVGCSENGSDFVRYSGTDWIKYTSETKSKSAEDKFNEELKNRKHKEYLDKELKPIEVKNDIIAIIQDLNNDNEVTGWKPEIGDITTPLTDEKRIKLVHLLKAVKIPIGTDGFTNIVDTPSSLLGLSKAIKAAYKNNLAAFPLVPLNKKINQLSELAAKYAMEKIKNVIKLDKSSEKPDFYQIEIAADGNGTIKVTKTETKRTIIDNMKDRVDNAGANLENAAHNAESKTRKTWNKVKPEFQLAGTTIKNIWQNAFGGTYGGYKGLWYEKLYNMTKYTLIATGRTLKYLTVGAAPRIVKGTFLTGVGLLALLWRKVKRKKAAGKKTDLLSEASNTLTEGTKSVGRFAKFASKHLKNTRMLKVLTGIPIIGVLFAGAAKASGRNILPKARREEAPKKGETIKYPLGRGLKTIKKNSELRSRAYLLKDFKIQKGCRLILPIYQPRTLSSRLLSRFRRDGRAVSFYIPHNKKVNGITGEKWMASYYSDAKDQIEFKAGSVLPAKTILPAKTKLILTK
ncbi:hypothetical protein KKG71_06145 [Patescibacteria group bacterium]|nr:hypothetical protein [Patescibacteria group bacterium]